MTAVRLSERQQAALLALADHGAPITGSVLAGQMTANGRDTSTAAAFETADALRGKGLAVKRHHSGQSVRYELTDQGRRLAAQIRAAS